VRRKAVNEGKRKQEVRERGTPHGKLLIQFSYNMDLLLKSIPLLQPAKFSLYLKELSIFSPSSHWKTLLKLANKFGSSSGKKT